MSLSLSYHLLFFLHTPYYIIKIHQLQVICNARAKGFDSILSKIILFATDVETYDLASSLGITSFYSKEIFEEMPKVAAKEYADDIFRLLMFAKVWCVHMVSQLGYNFLFQDVDVIWYKNPLQVCIAYCWNYISSFIFPGWYPI